MKNEELLNDLYYVQLNFDGIENLYKKAKKIQPDIKKSLVKEWLEKQQSAQMNNDKVIKKEFLPIYSEDSYSFQMDLTFLNKYKGSNNGNYILFTAINVNSRYAYAYYSNNKNMNTILNFLKEMEKKTVINTITADEGSEFKNKEFIDFCNNNNISLFLIKGDSHKLGIINRFHRTLKSKLTKYFSAKDTSKWIDIIDKIIYNYNHTINRGIGIEPAKVNSFIENEIRTKAKETTEAILEKEQTINVGDRCRIKTTKTIFTDKLESKFSNNLYTITKINKGSVIVIDNEGIEYKVKKYNIKIVKEVENITNLKERKEVIKKDKVERNIKKAGVNEADIITYKRTKKGITKLDL